MSHTRADVEPARLGPMRRHPRPATTVEVVDEGQQLGVYTPDLQDAQHDLMVYRVKGLSEVHEGGMRLVGDTGIVVFSWWYQCFGG